MSESATFRINVKTGEIEITGSEAFVEARIDSLNEILELVAEASLACPSNDIVPVPEPTPQATDAPEPVTTPSKLPETFGEWMHSFRDNINDQEKALMTARFVQEQSATNDFKTAEVNKSLKDHGIKLSNPSKTLKQLEDKKFLFQTRKEGKLSFKRISRDGENHLSTLKRES